MTKKIKYTSYTAGPIEADTSSGMSDWRDKVDCYFEPFSNVAIYNPIKREMEKTGKLAGEHIKYVEGLIRSGNKELGLEEMDKIWLGDVRPDHDLISIFQLMRHRKLMDGNYLNEYSAWGDYEAVIRSDFIIAYIKKDVSTVGTIIELFVALLFKIPVYLVLDHTKTEANKTLITMTWNSGGEIFYKLNDCLHYIANKYQIK